MAVTSGTIISSTSNYSFLYVNWQQVSQSATNNTTTINWQCGINISQNASWGSNSIRFDNVIINGTTVQGSITTGNISGTGDHTIAEGTLVIPHNTDGSKTFSMSFSGWLIGAGTLIGSGSFELNKIARNPIVTKYTVDKRSATTLSGTFTADSTIDYMWYRYKKSSASSYSNWVGIDITDGTAASFIISGLSANTTYNTQIRVRRKDNQLTTDSSVVNQTTNKLPAQMLDSKTEDKISITWSLDEVADEVWYSLDKGKNWLNITTTANAKSGTYTIEKLTPNTIYNIMTKLRRKSNEVTDTTTNLSITTYDITHFTPLVTKHSDTSLEFNYYADSLLSKIEYRYRQYVFDGEEKQYSSWINAKISESKSGVIIIDNLDIATTYEVQFRTTRKATPTDTYVLINPIKDKTDEYPYITYVRYPNLLIGSPQIIEFHNPWQREIEIYMTQKLNDEPLYVGTTNKPIFKFIPDETKLYNSIPNSNSANIRYWCLYKGMVIDSSKQCTYSIDNSNGQANPKFDTSNWSYADINNITTSLTNNNQIIVNGQSTVKFNIDKEATSFTGTEIDYYKFVCGLKYNTIGTITNVNSDILEVIAIDKRGNSTSSRLDIKNNYVYYYIPTLSKGEANRENGVGTDTALSINGKMFRQKFVPNGVWNSFNHVYYYVSTDNENWSSRYSIPTSNVVYNSNNGTYSLTDIPIHADGTTGGFEVGKRYYLKIELVDKLTTTTFTGIEITDGKIALDVFQDYNGDYYRGINGLAESNYALKVHGKLKVTDSIEGKVENATKSDNEKVTLTNPTTSATYFLPFISGIGDGSYNVLRGNNGVRYQTLEGTASVEGISRLILGNGTAKGQDGNKRGFARVYDSTTYYCNLQTNGNYSGNRTFTLPNHNGTIQVRPVNLYNNESGGTGTITLSASASSYTYIEITYGYDTARNSTRIYKDSQRGTMSLQLNLKDDTCFISANILVSGTTLTFQYNRNMNVSSTGTITFNTTRQISIFNVDGII